MYSTIRCDAISKENLARVRGNSARKNPFHGKNLREGVLKFKKKRRHYVLYSTSLDRSCIFFFLLLQLRPPGIETYLISPRVATERCGYTFFLFQTEKEKIKNRGQITDVFRTDDSAVCDRLRLINFHFFFFTPITFGLLNQLLFCIYTAFVYARKGAFEQRVNVPFVIEMQKKGENFERKKEKKIVNHKSINILRIKCYRGVFKKKKRPFCLSNNVSTGDLGNVYVN